MNRNIYWSMMIALLLCIIFCHHFSDCKICSKSCIQPFLDRKSFFWLVDHFTLLNRFRVFCWKTSHVRPEKSCHIQNSYKNVSSCIVVPPKIVQNHWIKYGVLKNFKSYPSKKQLVPWNYNIHIVTLLLNFIDDTENISETFKDLILSTLFGRKIIAYHHRGRDIIVSWAKRSGEKAKVLSVVFSSLDTVEPMQLH